MSILNSLALTINATAREHGFYDKQETLEEYMNRACANLHDEVSELHEAFRNNKLYALSEKGMNMTYLEEELADIIIRALDTAYYLNVDIHTSVLSKMEYNKTRPYKHGNKRS